MATSRRLPLWGWDEQGQVCYNRNTAASALNSTRRPSTVAVVPGVPCHFVLRHNRNSLSDRRGHVASFQYQSDDHWPHAGDISDTSTTPVSAGWALVGLQCRRCPRRLAAAGRPRCAGGGRHDGSHCSTVNTRFIAIHAMAVMRAFPRPCMQPCTTLY